MPAYRDGTQWRYRKLIRTLKGDALKISGTPKINTKMDAERAERAHITRALRPPRVGEGTTFAQLVPRYLAVVELEQSASEMFYKRQKLTKRLVPTLGHLRVADIGPAELDELKVSLSERAPSTINNYLCVVGAVLSYARKLGIIEAVPELGILKVPPQDWEEYTDDEIDKLAAAGRDHCERAAVLLGADAGLRAGEIRGLRRADVGAGKLRVIHAEWNGHQKAPKSGKARTVPMTPRLAAAVSAALLSHASPTVLAKPNGLGWTYHLMRDRLRANICPLAGVEYKGWHALRHSFCSRLARAGAPARAIQEVAGHASITTTERYMHLGADQVESAIALLDRFKSIAKPTTKTKKASVTLK